jgi:uncharacterized protein (TIGR00369 family)
MSARDWIEKSGYSAALGVRLDAFDGACATLRLPYSDGNSNPGRALHGGCAASLGILGGQTLARAALGDDAGPFHTFSVQVNYLSAAIGKGVVAEARLLRKGKELCFAAIDVATDEGKTIAHITTGVRGRFAHPAPELAPAVGDDGASDPGPMGPHISRLPYVAGRGIDVELMKDGRSRLTMPLQETNADASGGVHEGAVLALLDTTGAMASWAETGPGPFKASTPSMQAQLLAPPAQEDLVGYGRVVQRDRELFWSDVEIAGAESGRLVARGTVIYRIVT